ncbi:MAG: recombinase A [Candidatus Polarisedimenticolia bacterium]
MVPVPASSPLVPAAAPRPAADAWGWESFAGRIAELAAVGGAARLSLAFGLVREAQRRGEPAAWVAAGAGSFYPPDAAACGVRLEALPVVFVPGLAAAARAADTLLRSGGFGLVVVDVVGAAGELPAPLATRLAGLARKHDAAVVFLAEAAEGAPSLTPLVGLRCAARRAEAGPGRFVCRAEALKDKRRGPGWAHEEIRRGPVGLR